MILTANMIRSAHSPGSVVVAALGALFTASAETKPQTGAERDAAQRRRSGKIRHPQLHKTAEDFAKGELAFPKALSLQNEQSARDTIRAIETSTESPELIRTPSNHESVTELS